jgi:hypothetical protein
MAKQALEDGNGIQVDSVEAMTQYFGKYYGVSDNDLGQKLIECRQGQYFATLAQQFEMISSRTRDIFVPDDEEARKAIQRLYASRQLTRELRQLLQRHTVGLNPSEFQKASQVLSELTPASEVWIAADPAYDEQLGLVFQIGTESLVL